jgi:hypothetical protein
MKLTFYLSMKGAKYTDLWTNGIMSISTIVTGMLPT